MTTITWNSAIDGNFADAADWSSGTVPGPKDGALIGASGDYTVTSSADETVTSLDVASAATLDLTGAEDLAQMGMQIADPVAAYSAGQSTRTAGSAAQNPATTTVKYGQIR